MTKPSEILREMPPERWAEGVYCTNWEHPEDASYCAAGWLAKETGYDYEDQSRLGHVDSHLLQWMQESLGITATSMVLQDMLRINDKHGLPAVIEYLEAKGL